MKRILFILLLTTPFIVFGQSNYQINTGEEPISENSNFLVFNTVEEYTYNYSSKEYIFIKELKKKVIIYIDSENEKIGIITESKTKQYDVVGMDKDNGYRRFQLEKNPTVNFHDNNDIIYKNKKDYNDLVTFIEESVEWSSKPNYKTGFYETVIKYTK